MNIVYSSSNSYAEICGVSLTSLLYNNQNVEKIDIYIIDNDISENNKKRLLKTAENYKRNINFVNKIDLDVLTQTKVYVGRWNIGTFFRLYLGSILPKTVERVIYIDCDTIIRHSIEDVYNLDLGDCSVAGVDDCRSDLYRDDIETKHGTIYMNNGFMLIDLKKWRDQKIEEAFTEFIHSRNGDCTYMDQAPLNNVLGNRNQIYALPARYNSQRVFYDFTYKELMRLRKPKYHLSEEEFIEAINDPIVVHFTPVFITGTRPWQIKDNHRYTPEWKHYKEISEWKNEPYRKDDRKIGKKIMTLICKICPKFIMIPIMSYLHSVWYPKHRMKLTIFNRGVTINE